MMVKEISEKYVYKQRKRGREMPKKWNDIKHRGMTREEIKTADERVKDTAMRIRLSELRKTANITQAELSRRLGIPQSNISRLEHRVADNRISTLRNYVKALGGRLEIVAVINDKPFLLSSSRL